MREVARPCPDYADETPPDRRAFLRLAAAAGGALALGRPVVADKGEKKTQRKLALCPETPDEAEIAFKRDKGKFEGIPVTEMSKDQRAHLQKVLQLLIEPYRKTDRDEVVKALKTQGGLDKCHLAFYQADDLGKDGVWDNWRLEGPAFVWHWRGAPHVHVWVNVADDPKVDLNAKNLSGPLRK